MDREDRPLSEEAVRTSTETARLLLQLTREVSRSLDLQDVLDRTFDALGQLVPFNGGAIQLVEDGSLVAAATVPQMTEEARRVRIPVGQGISGAIAASGEQIYIPDITRDERVPEEARRRGASGGVRSYFGAPLIERGEPMGVLQIDSLEVDAFTPAMRASVISFLPAVSSAVSNALSFQREREALEQLKQADLMQRNFMAVVSHELRTPLAVVLGFTETLAKKVDDFDAEQVADMASRTYNAASRLERLVNDLIQVSQVERRRLHIQIADADVTQILEHVHLESADTGHNITVDIQASLPLIRTDADRAVQVLDNLVGNARKFSSPGSTIIVSARQESDRVEISVTDEGRGVPAELRKRIFDPFFQVDASATRHAGGLGIGLYLAREVCAQMGATISVESAPGTGSRFSVSFPTADPGGGDAPVTLFKPE